MYLSDVAITNISESFSHKMAAKPADIDGTKLRHCQHGDSDVIQFLVYATGFRRHLVGKTLINIFALISLK